MQLVVVRFVPDMRDAENVSSEVRSLSRFRGVLC